MSNVTVFSFSSFQNMSAKRPHPVGSGQNVFSCPPERIKPWKSFLHEVKSPLHKLSWLSQLLFTSNISLIDLTFINAIVPMGVNITFVKRTQSSSYDIF
jgi:hypothetical protein